MKRKKKVKFKKPPTGLVSRGIGKNPVSAITYHKNFAYDKIRYTVLTINQISEDHKDTVAATLKSINTGAQMMTLPDGVNGWACKVLDHMGRCYLVSYKGIEVALYYHRQLTEVIPQPGDRVPEGVCQDPSEAWQRLDLIGRSAKQSSVVLANMQRRQEEEISSLKSHVKSLEELNGRLESELYKLSLSDKDRRRKQRIAAEARKKRKSPKSKHKDKRRKK